MPLTRPMPPGARLVSVYIRNKITRPDELPVFNHPRKSVLAWDFFDHRACPLGLLPKAMTSFPTWVKDFRGGVPFSQDELIQFIKWWDEQEDAQAATDAVWGPETKEDG